MKKLHNLFALLLTCFVFIGCRGDNEISVESVVVDRESYILFAGETVTFNAHVLPRNADNQNIRWTSSNRNVATIDPNTGELTALSGGTTRITAASFDRWRTAYINVTVEFNISDSEQGIDVGGLRWATRNLAAPGFFADSPTCLGMFYQWNRSVAWETTGDVTNWNTSVPTGTTWTAENDPCPGGWRLPTIDELKTLMNERNVWATYNEVNGRVFGVAPDQIFLPAAGWRIGATGELDSSDVGANYWSSTQDVGVNAWSFHFTGSLSPRESRNDRRNGFSIRCIAE